MWRIALAGLLGVACSKSTTTPEAPAPEAAATAAATGEEKTLLAGGGPAPTANKALAAQLLKARAMLVSHPSDAEAHVDMARALLAVRAEGSPCTYGATLDEVLSQLEQAVSFSPTIASTLSSDPALEGVRTTIRFQVLIDTDLSDTQTASAVLMAADWYGLPEGVLPYGATLDLGEGGVVTGVRRTLGEAGVTEAGFNGTWALEGGWPGLLLTLDGATRNLSLTREGRLLDGADVKWVNLPSECGA